MTAACDDDAERMIRLNEEMVRRSEDFFGYVTPVDFRMEQRHPELFPTNVRPETLAQEAEMKRQAAEGELEPAEFLRFTSAVTTGYAENDQVNARWYPAPEHKEPGRPKQAIIVMPQWNADAISHNALCKLFNRFGVSALRLSKPYHDIRRPAEIERSDYAVSANIGRTLAACRQAVVDVRSCMDWLETQGYTQFGVLGTSLGSCYAFIAAAHDARLRVCAFNHASTWFGDVVWEGQSTRHVRAAFEEGADPGRGAAAVPRHQPDGVHGAVCGDGEAGAGGVCQVRPDVSAAPVAGGAEELRPLRDRLCAQGAAVRALHHRRDAVQVHRRMVFGIVCVPGVPQTENVKRSCPAGRAHCAWGVHFVTWVGLRGVLAMLATEFACDGREHRREAQGAAGSELARRV